MRHNLECFSLQKWVALITTLAFMQGAWAGPSGGKLAGGKLPSKPLSPTSQAKQHAQRAASAYDAERFQEALESYRSAYTLDPRPLTLFNIAQCLRRLGEDQEALQLYKEYLGRLHDKAANAPLVHELIADLEARQVQRLAAAEAARQETLAQETAIMQKRLALQATNHQWIQPVPEAQQERMGSSDSLLQRWWFWAGILAVGAAAGTTIYMVNSQQARPTTLGTVSFR